VRCNCTVAPRENFEQSATRFGEMLQGKMAEKQLSIRELSAAVGSTYEYIRKLVRGLALPSKYMINTLAPILDMDVAEAQRLIDTDKLAKKFVGFTVEVAGKNPELESMERGWQDLTDSQKEALLMQFKTYIAQNKKHRRDAANV